MQQSLKKENLLHTSIGTEVERGIISTDHRHLHPLGKGRRSIRNTIKEVEAGHMNIKNAIMIDIINLVEGEIKLHS